MVILMITGFLTGVGGGAASAGEAFTVTCTSKGEKTQTISATGGGDAAIGTAPSGNSTWVVFKNGPYLNCFHVGTSTPPDFTGNLDCQKYAGTPGHGRYLASCTFH